MSRKSRYLRSVRTKKGVVRVWHDRFDPNFDTGKYQPHQIGHRWDKGYLVTVERWQETATDERTWSEWAEINRSAERVRLKRPPAVPPLTDEELDAWADHVLPYVERGNGTTCARVASLLDGWDDVQTFWPGRKPHDYSTELWDYDDPARTPNAPARQRSYALARLALNRLVKRGLARRIGSNWWVRPDL